MPGAQEADERAAELAWRLPPELAPLARIALDYRWSWDPDGAELFRGARPARMGAPRPEPGSTARRPDAAPGGDGRLARPDPRADRPAAARARGGPRAPRDADRRARRPGRLRLRGVRRPPVAAHLLRRARRARRRHPQGRERPRAAGDRGRAALPARGTSSSASTGRGCSTSTGRRSCPSGCRRFRCATKAAAPLTLSFPLFGREVAFHVWRAEIGRVPLYLLDAELEENDPRRPVDHGAALRGEPASRARPVRAARPRDGARAPGTRDRARRAALQRGPSRARRARAGGRGRGDGRADRRCARSGARALRVHDAHPGTGRERDVRDRRRSSRRSPTCRRASGIDAEQVPRPLPHPSGKRRVAGHDAARAAALAPRERGQHAPRRGRARDVASALRRRVGRRGADHARHERRPPADVPLPADARAARPAPRRGLARPGVRPGDVGARRRDPRRGALGGPQRGATPRSSTT